jgi:hypothetical protein
MLTLDEIVERLDRCAEQVKVWRPLFCFAPIS